MIKVFVYTAIISSFLLFTSWEIAFANIDSSGGNYEIVGDTLESGGGEMSTSSTNYDALSSLGASFVGFSDSTTYSAEFGYNNEIIAATPHQPTFTNDDEYYSKLKFILNSTDASNNPTDTKYAIAITSASDWSDPTKIEFVQDTYAIGSSLGIEDFMTYSELGGASGIFITGLAPNTTYRVRVSALQGDFTGTDFGAEATASTVEPYINFTLSSTSVDFGVLSYNSIATASPTVTVTVNTNVYGGYTLKVADEGDGSNAGLYDSTSGKLVASQTETLSAGSEGYGLQADSTTATIAPLYDKSGNDVGALSRTAQVIASNSTNVSGETVDVTSMASTSTTTEGGNYSDVITYTIISAL